MATGDEFEPYVIVRVTDGRLECALCALDADHSALAIFLTAEAAEEFRQSAAFSAEWRIAQPARDELVEILRHCVASDVLYAVLDPASGDKRLFDLQEVLAASEEDGGA